ncbi:MAG: hypothetical protein ACI9IA_001621 [Enterobacterales bacterium]|jgi:hypothetical protein
MNTILKLKLATFIAITSLPLYADDTSGQAGLNACADALAKKLETEQGKPVGYNLDSDTKINNEKLKVREVFYLDAKVPNTDVVIARANCTVNDDAEVLKLVVLPLDAAQAQNRATKLY